MAAVLKHRRGTTAVRTAYTPQVSELFYDTTLNEMFVGNGTTAGGVPFSAATALATLSDVAVTTPTNHDYLVYISGTSKWTNETPTFVTSTLINFVGDAGSGGTKGLVPPPASGDAAAGKLLSAGGGWVTAPGTGTVTQVNTGTGLTGGPITTTGTVSIANTAVTPGAYTLADITVDQQGRITAAASGTASGGGLFNQVMSATPTSAGTSLTNWLNQGSASVADTAVGVTITLPSGSGQNLASRYLTTAPGTPYKIHALVSMTMLTMGDGSDNPAVGIGWTDGTQLHVMQLIPLGGSGQAILQVQKRTTSTAAATTDYSTQKFQWSGAMLWMEIANDGTNVSFGFSFDGVNYATVFSVAKASGFLGSSGYTHPMFTVGGEANGAATKFGTLLSWTVV